MVLDYILKAGSRVVNAGARTVEFVRNLDYNPVSWCRKTRRLLRDTPSEILILAALTGLTAGTISYSHENERAGRIPLGFSEITQIEKDAKYAHEEVGPMTHYLTTTNDVAMKVFESWDLSNEHYKNQTVMFARELEVHVDPAFKTHTYNLPALLEKLPSRAGKALAELKDFVGVMSRTKFVNQEFDDAWDESHIDHYRTETYTETETDSNGRTRTVTKTRQVYDHTTHSYTYRKEQGEEASKLLDKLIAEYPELKFKEKLRTASQTNAEGEYAAERSRKAEKRKSSSFDFVAISNTWATGATLTQNLPVIYSSWQNLHSDAESWRKAKSNAHSTSYNTYSRSDSGPKEFRIAEEALKNGTDLKSYIEEIVDGIQFSQQNASALEQKAREFIGVVLDNKPGNEKKLSKNVLDLSKEMYSKNFKGGFDVRRFRGELVAFWILMGLVSGGFAGFGADKLFEKYKVWDGSED